MVTASNIYEGIALHTMIARFFRMEVCWGGGGGVKHLSSAENNLDVYQETKAVMLIPLCVLMTNISAEISFFETSPLIIFTEFSQSLLIHLVKFVNL